MMGHIQDNKELLEKAGNITCVSDYLDVLSYVNKIRKTNNIYNNSTLFFRGYADESWQDEPSIYRKYNDTSESLIYGETNLFYEMVSKCPDDFQHCRTALDHLVMMQHYSLPTRLLDITENPLVALYFACEDHKKKTSAQVAIYDIPNKDLHNYNSDTVAMVSNIAKVGVLEFSTLVLKLDREFNNFNKYVSEYNPQTSFIESKAYNYFQYMIKNCEERLDKNDIKCFLNMVFINYAYKILQSDFSKDIERNTLEVRFQNLSTRMAELPSSEKHFTNAQLHIRNVLQNKIYHHIQEEKAYININTSNIMDFEQVIAVKTKQDNPNIIKQNGAFFLFGVTCSCDDKRECVSIPDYYYLRTTQSLEKISCKIRHEFKKDILDELDYLSISKNQLFPNIKDTAGYLKEKYVSKYTIETD